MNEIFLFKLSYNWKNVRNNFFRTHNGLSVRLSCFQTVFRWKASKQHITSFWNPLFDNDASKFWHQYVCLRTLRIQFKVSFYTFFNISLILNDFYSRFRNPYKPQDQGGLLYSHNLSSSQIPAVSMLYHPAMIVKEVPG